MSGGSHSNQKPYRIRSFLVCFVCVYGMFVSELAAVVHVCLGLFWVYVCAV